MLRRSHVLVSLGVILVPIQSCDVTDRDIIDPRLPSYTEGGTGSAGGYIDSEPWRHICIITPWSPECNVMEIMFDSTANASAFGFSGNQFLLSGDERAVSMSFKLPGIPIRNHTELEQLQGVEFAIDGLECIASLSLGNSEPILCEGGGVFSNGKMHIRNVGLSGQENGFTTSNFSGTFGYVLESPCWRHEVYQGRFSFDVYFNN